MFRVTETLIAAFVAGMYFAAIGTKQNTLYFAALIVCAAILLFGYLKKCSAKWQLTVALAVIVLVCGVQRYNHAIIINPSDINHHAGNPASLTARVDSIPTITLNEAGGYDVSFRAALTADNSIDGRSVTGAVRLLVTVASAAEIPLYGDEINFFGTIRLPTAYKNPGQSDYREYLAQQGMTAIVKANSVKRLQAGGWVSRLSQVRQNIILLNYSNLPVAIASVYNAIMFGGSGGISKSIYNDFRLSGVIHILSVSGTHISVIAAAVFWVCNCARVNKRYSALAALGATWIYVFWSAFVAAAVRSAIMGSFMLLAIALRQEPNTKRALWLAIFVILAINPLNIFNVGFLLSAAATAGIAYLYAPCSRFIARIMPLRLAQPIAFTLAAQIGVLPVMAYYFNGFSLLALIANLIVVPFIDAILVAGLTAMLIPWLSIKLLIVTIAGKILGGILYINSLIAKLPGGKVYFPALSWWLTLWYYVWLVALVALPKEMHVFRVKLDKQFFLLCGSAAWLAALILVVIIPVRPQIHFIDVGEGDSALVITPHHHAVLIDCGGSFKRSEDDFDVGERVVAPYLLHYGVRTLDAVVITHPHVDHIGGLAAVSAVIPIEHLYGVDNIVEEYVVDGCKFELTEIDSGESSGGNNRMVLVRVNFDDRAALITGDLGVKGEELLLQKGLAKRIDILKVGHHGSATSTSSQFLLATQPQAAVISVGEGNRYGHPNASVLARLNEAGVALFRTDHDGAVRFELSDDKWRPFTYIRQETK